MNLRIHTGILSVVIVSFQYTTSAATPIPSSATPTVIVSTAAETVAKGKFKPSWTSLKQYEVTEWFRDAKIGKWALFWQSAHSLSMLKAV
jgi:hypothetical protein